MTTAATDLRVNTTIQGLSKQRNGEGWMLVLECQYNDSQHPVSLFGKDWDQVKGHGIQDGVCVTFRRGRLKDGKSGSKSYDFFYDLVGLDVLEPNLQMNALPAHTPPANMAAAGAQVAVPPPPFDQPNYEAERRRYEAEGMAGEDDGTTAPPPQEQGYPAPDHVQVRIDKGMAFNAAYTMAASPMDGDWGNEDAMLAYVRRLRDRFLHEVIEVPIAPAHYCYEHESPRRYVKNREDWFHEHEGGFCLKQGGIIPPQEPEASPPSVDAGKGPADFLGDQPPQDELPF